MRLPSRLAYLLSAFVLIQTGLACEDEIIRVTHGGSTGTLIRYRVQINAFVQTGVLASGSTDQIQCLNQNDVVTVTVTEVNGQPVSFPASGSPRTASGTPGEVLNFTISGTAPQINWRVDTRTCNQTLFDQVYQVVIDGQVVRTSDRIRPGDCFEFVYSDPQKKSIQLVRYTMTPDGERTNPEYSRTIGPDDAMWYQDGSSTPGFNSGSDNPVGVPNANTGQGKIPYAQTPDLAKEDTLRKVGDAIYDATAQAARSTVDELRGVNGKLSAVENEIRSGFINVNGNLVSVKAALDLVNAGSSGVQSRLDTLNATATQTKGVMENQYAKIISMDAKFDTANGYLLNLKDGQQVVIDKLGNIGTDLNGVAKDATLTATKSTIASEAQSTRDALGTINTTIGQTKDAIGLGNQVNQEGHLATRTAVDQVKSVLASVYAAIEGARTEANVSASAIQGKLDVGNTHLSGIKDNTAAINAQLNGFGNKLDTISGKIQTNTESTAQRLDEIIDLLDYSDFAPDVGGQSFAGSAAGSEMKGHLDGVAAGLTIPSIPTVPTSPWKVTLWTRANGQPWEVDLNPLSYPSLATFAAWLRNVLVWVSTAIYVMACYQVVHEALLLAPAARQSTSASSVPMASSGFALLAAPLITVSLATIPAVFIAFMSAGGYYSVINANPFAGGDSVIQMGVSLAAAFLPLETILEHIVLFFVFKIKLGAVYWLACTIVRFIVG